MIPIILVCGPSGSGKTSLVDSVLVKEFAKIRRIRSITTRPVRSDKEEQDRQTYSFATELEFTNAAKEGKIVEWDRFCDNFYGTHVEEFDEDAFGPSDALIKVATAPGIAGFRRWIGDNSPPRGEAPKYQIFTILIDADLVALASRLGGRGDDPDVLRDRISGSMEEREAYAEIHWDVVLDTSYMSLPEASLMFESAILGILSVCDERNNKWETA